VVVASRVQGAVKEDADVSDGYCHWRWDVVRKTGLVSQEEKERSLRQQKEDVEKGWKRSCDDDNGALTQGAGC
jgi:hypothetical protein